MDPKSLRRELRDGDDRSIKFRRGIIGVSVVGMASMTAVALLQTGFVKHLPDPRIKGFNSDQVTLSDTAFALGVPDGSLSLASFAANIPLAAAGDSDRARRLPWLPIAAAAKAGVESLVSAWYVRREKAWCSYCLVAAAANVAIFALTIPELRRALKQI